MAVRDIKGKQIEFDEEGFMVDSTQWNEEIAAVLAAEIGVDPLTDRHWQIIQFCRKDFAEQGDAPTLRRITKEAGIPTKELYKLFPKGPAKKVAYVSGLGKPTGCI